MADDLGIDLDRAPVRSHEKIKDRFRLAAALWRSFPNDRNPALCRLRSPLCTGRKARYVRVCSQLE